MLTRTCVKIVCVYPWSYETHIFDGLYRKRVLPVINATHLLKIRNRKYARNVFILFLYWISNNEHYNDERYWISLRTPKAIPYTLETHGWLEIRTSWIRNRNFFHLECIEWFAACFKLFLNSILYEQNKCRSQIEKHEKKTANALSTKFELKYEKICIDEKILQKESRNICRPYYFYKIFF